MTAKVSTENSRSQTMAAVKGKNTKYEILLRKALYSRGFRYRVNVAVLPGKPDLVLRKYSAVIFVNGCFWHWHDCALFQMPKTRTEFWEKKLAANKANDFNCIERLSHQGWRVLTVWECALRGPGRLELDMVIGKIAQWIEGETNLAEIKGWDFDSGQLVTHDD